MIENKGTVSKIRLILTYIFVIMLGIICLIPMINMVAISFSGSTAIAANKVGLWPVDFTTAAYVKIMDDSQFWRSFLNSVIRVVAVLAMSMPVTLMMAYSLSRSIYKFPEQKIYNKLLVIAMIFNGGMIPTYMVIRQLGLCNSLGAVIFPYVVVPFNVMLMTNFFRGLPEALEEAAIIDGANPLQILLRVYIPCSKPSIATVALFTLVDNWNEFFSGVIYMTRAKYYPLMTYVNSLNLDLEELAASGSIDVLKGIATSGISQRNLNAAKIMVAVVPLLCIYPLLQRYLITGMVMGAVKE